MSKKYQDYYKNHIGYNSVSREAYLLKYYQDNFGVLLLDKFDIKNIRVLEIGCGKGTFAKYCASIGVGEYYGFDLDEQAISDNKKTFQENNTYIFSSENVAKFMRDHKNDIIFMSHVLEHLDESDASIYIQAIYQSLNKGGMFINVMPNGGSLFSSNIGRYEDITHEKLYIEVSLHQLLMQEDFQAGSISHRNSISGPFFIRIFRKIGKYIMKNFIKILGYPVSMVDTFEIITIAKK